MIGALGDRLAAVWRGWVVRIEIKDVEIKDEEAINSALLRICMY